MSFDRRQVQQFPNGVRILKWPHRQTPTEDSVRKEMTVFGYTVYDLQTCPPWFERSRHAHDHEEIRGAVSGVITVHFDEFPVTIEAGDILIVPGGTAHEVISHNGQPFSAFKGSTSGERTVTEHGDGKGSIEELAREL
jgi:mannose-6-phosphate isomerase-like protein (cupin superfamily)